MSTKLKSFRIDSRLISALENMSKDMGVSQSALIASALEQLVTETEQWQADLALIKNDKKYRKEQEELANEFYEDF